MLAGVRGCPGALPFLRLGFWMLLHEASEGLHRPANTSSSLRQHRLARNWQPSRSSALQPCLLTLGQSLLLHLKGAA